MGLRSAKLVRPHDIKLIANTGIKISEIKIDPNDQKQYSGVEDIYTQIVEGIDIPAILEIVNRKIITSDK